MIILRNSKLVDLLLVRPVSVTFENIIHNSKAASGGERDVNFLKFLVDSKLLVQSESVLRRSNSDIVEEYYLERYKKMNFESDRHFLCRTVIQDELKKLGIETMSGIGAGNMSILRADSNYDIVAADFSAMIDVGLTPARNYFRGLTDLRVRNYLITTYFDDYMDDIIFCTFSRANDQNFLDAITDYQEGFKDYTPNYNEQPENRMYYNNQFDSQ